VPQSPLRIDGLETECAHVDADATITARA
jgi:hypothetical protein